MATMYVLPIEPLAERYSAQWLGWLYKYLPNAVLRSAQLSASCNRVRIIEGEGASTTIKEGAFLDAVSTNTYKASQLRKLCELIDAREVRSGDVVLVMDGWFPGVEMLAYIRDLTGVRFRLCACMHAGTYDPNDHLTRMGLGKWAATFEAGWLHLYDAVFVATEYHKDLILSTRPVEDADKIVVTGFPFYVDDLTLGDNIGGRASTAGTGTQFSPVRRAHEEGSAFTVVFPHRLQNEKRPDVFADVERLCADTLSTQGVHYRFVRTKDECNTKARYYCLLRNAHIAVSCAEQETWGIAMQEATVCGCVPLMPRRLSYAEMYPEALLYDNIQDLVTMILRAATDDKYSTHLEVLRRRVHLNIIEVGEAAFDNMASAIASLEERS